MSKDKDSLFIYGELTPVDIAINPDACFNSVAYSEWKDEKDLYEESTDCHGYEYTDAP